MPPPSIKMVLWDMDRTLLNTHTRGLWKDDIKKLAKEVTRAFKILVPHLLFNKYSVGIVTFSDKLVLSSEGGQGGSAGETLVNDLLTETFMSLYSKVKSLKEHKEHVKQNAEYIRSQVFVAAALPQLRNQQDSKLRMPNSKRWHIDQVVEKYKERTGKKLKYEEIMLFDDTVDNVKAALETGVHAFAVPPTSAFTSTCWERALETLENPGEMISKLK
mmetsp:Transcript_32889/g.61175  ORF Transcript_32889/g.61175 Transcript_32889/m.61175 type:complete len:217 (+) Transcript_32889:135-785(+)